jgi:hypothetical protein
VFLVALGMMALVVMLVVAGLRRFVVALVMVFLMALGMVALVVVLVMAPVLDLAGHVMLLLMAFLGVVIFESHGHSVKVFDYTLEPIFIRPLVSRAPQLTIANNCRMCC